MTISESLPCFVIHSGYSNAVMSLSVRSFADVKTARLANFDNEHKLAFKYAIAHAAAGPTLGNNATQACATQTAGCFAGSIGNLTTQHLPENPLRFGCNGRQPLGRSRCTKRADQLLCRYAIFAADNDLIGQILSTNFAYRQVICQLSISQRILSRTVGSLP